LPPQTHSKGAEEINHWQNLIKEKKKKKLEKEGRFANTFEHGICLIEKKIVDIGAEDWKPAYACVCFESSVNDPSNNIILVHHEPYWSRASINVDCNQEPILLNILQHH